MNKGFLLLSFLILLVFVTTNAQQINVKFQVDMRAEESSGRFNPANGGPFVGGSINAPAWDFTEMQAAGNGLYEKTKPLNPNTAGYTYLFFINPAWDGLETAMRPLTTGSSDTTLTQVFYGGTEYTGVATDIRFTVDMKQKVSKGEFNPVTDTAFVFSALETSSPSYIKMTSNGDTTYSYTSPDTITSGRVIEYVFAIGTSSGRIKENDFLTPAASRFVGICDTGNVVKKLWNDNVGYGFVTFEVDVSVLDEVGLFDPEKDGMAVPGGFNGWDYQTNVMQPDALNPSIWFRRFEFNKKPIGTSYMYSYRFRQPPSHPFLQKDDGNVSYEHSLLNPVGGNHVLIFEGKDDQLETRYFADRHPGLVIPQGKSVSITFRLDMTGVADFNPQTDTVWLKAQEGMFPATIGKQSFDLLLALDQREGTSMIVSGTLNINGPSINGIKYNYIFKGEHNGDDGISAGNSGNIRFVGMDGYRSYIQPYTAPLDVWGVRAAEPIPPFTTDVKETNGLVTAYNLEANYPNPFNPTTRIEFSIPEGGLVSLKVFNVLGQEVATLVNEELTANSYEFDFVANDLSSGVYFYALKANNFVATKKMILLK